MSDKPRKATITATDRVFGIMTTLLQTEAKQQQFSALENSRLPEGHPDKCSADMEAAWVENAKGLFSIASQLPAPR